MFSWPQSETLPSTVNSTLSSAIDASESLAKRVLAIAKGQSSEEGFSKALRTFGRFSDQDSIAIYDTCKSLIRMDDFIGRPADTLPSNNAETKAGLVVPVKRANSSERGANSSLLGLDVLASEKRHEQAQKSHGLRGGSPPSHVGTVGNHDRVEFKKPKVPLKSERPLRRRRNDNNEFENEEGDSRDRQYLQRKDNNGGRRNTGDEGSTFRKSRNSSRDSGYYNRDDSYYTSRSRHDDFSKESYGSRKRGPSKKFLSTGNNDGTAFVSHSTWDPRDVEYPEEDHESIEDRRRWEEEQAHLDREWYMNSESQNLLGDEMHNPFADFETQEDKQREVEFIESQKRHLSVRATERMKENSIWERNRMITSGIAGTPGLETDFSTSEERRVHLLVHELRPHFLDGVNFTLKQQEITSVRDPQSDLAINARRGSGVVRERREFRERQKAATAATTLAGTSLGNVMGVKEASDEDVHKEQSRTSSTVAGKIGPKQEKFDNSARTKTYKEQRELLPAFAVREQLLSVIRDNQVLIVVGETGSGKTTQLSQFLYEDGYDTNGMIGCTQPRRVAAMSVAKRVSEEMGVDLGSVVGYSIRFEDVTSPDTVIKYMTDGVLLRESLVQNNLERYSVIIMDEAHERSLNTDILMGLLKKIISVRRDLKLIVTSATMNSQRFSDFFGGAPQFTIPGRTYPVDVMFSKVPCSDYVEAAVRQALQIHLSQPAGDILIFMTGQEDIEATCEIMADRLNQLDDAPRLSILPIYSQMPADLQAKIFESAESGVRKVVVATNIAETSLTVHGISYVVDSGYCKLKMYNAKMGIDTLQVTPISQANANQRSGRAGRTGPGVAYRLFTELAYIREMFQTTLPEIQRTNLSNTVLLLKSLGIKNILDFEFMDPPPMETLMASLYELWTLGALDNYGQLTEIGKKMSLFPMDPSLSKLIIMAEDYHCTEEVITIVSMLSVPSVFYRPKERAEESDAAREKFNVPESDHLTLLNVFLQWRRNGCSDSWCNKHFLHGRILRRARDVRQQLVEIMANQKISIKSTGSEWDIIRKVLCSSYFHQAATAKGIGEYTHLRSGMPCHLHVTSSLYGLGYLPDYVIYHELVLTSKEYMNVVTSVDPYWLAEFGGVYYSLKERVRNEAENYERVYSSKMKLEEQIATDRELDAQRKQSTIDVPKKPARKAVIRAKAPRRVRGF
ncbi:ATP-dependent RNA helicase Prp16 [Schizosaccharomyces cryophilus OY26]|uniref:Pre-mRNA-splicing factor ATP-dependent RNA helicase PRP16 n=1 Tax=Schizosaccharomyces cryophilus (strain OY26 / ATCC MYA-4695 / CBS 11777 / NBRC 106824 / NRRL Y48691) TaxID=653667 RepID=S9VNJ9_SCHCR|nr:ATP-dependent RNA helicase Prp16 [Schizosaccharomyces cryophilus OY26]EPY49538.1 ATP-dependent RNA helicase Prp16 [Schizosaccharomyces cryophilus OY26]